MSEAVDDVRYTAYTAGVISGISAETVSADTLISAVHCTGDAEGEAAVLSPCRYME